MADLESLIFHANTAELESADKKLSNLNRTGALAEKSTNKLNFAFKAQKNAVQQVGLQLQDVAVQLSMGTSLSRTMSQQLPQLFGAFGAGGAFVGLFASLAFVAGGPLIDSLFGSAKASKELQTALEELEEVIKRADDGTFELSKSFKKLSEAGGVSAVAALKEAIADAKDAIKEAKKEALDFSDDLSTSDLGGRFDQTKLAFTLLRKEFQDGKIPLQEYRDEMNKLFVASKKPTKEFRDLREQINKSADSSKNAFEALSRLRDIQAGVEDKTNKHQETISRLIERLTAQSQAANDASNSTDYYRAKQMGATSAELDRIQSLTGLINAQKEQEKAAREAAAKAERDAAALAAANNRRELLFDKRLESTEDYLRTESAMYTEAYNERLAIINAAENKGTLLADEANALRSRNAQVYASQQMSFYSGYFGNIASVFEDGFGKQNAITRAAFAAQKLLAIPQMVTATEQGAAMALALGPIAGPIMSGVIKGLGYAAIGTVVGTTLAGRAQGGQVAANTPYKVGEYGEEMFVPNQAGRIVPNHKIGAGGGAKLELTTNVKVIGGNGNAEVTNNVTQISDTKFVENIVVRMMSDSSSKGFKSMQSVSNLQPRGRR